jgi:hypothetical protein
MLKEEVIFTFIEKQPVGIIHPVLFWSEVKDRAEILGEYALSRVRLHGAYLILYI